MASLAMFAPFVVSGTAYAAPEDNVDINLTAEVVESAAKNRNGLTFKGFGILSGNSTSAVLLDYKAEHPDKYWELMNVLYGGDHPILNTVKIEMGNDRNTSTGPNAATMRTADEYPNVQREPGFQLAADAKKVAKDPSQVHVSLLSWELPTWVGSWWNADAQKRQYKWYKNTILAAYRQYGYMVNSVNPDKNETGDPDEANLKQWAGWIKGDTTGFDSEDANKGFKAGEKELFNAIEIIGGDTVGTPGNNFGPNLTNDKDLQNAVDIAGFHYSSADDGSGSFKKVAEELDKEVWNSEGQATFSNTADRPNNSMNATSGSGNGSAGNEGTGIGGTNSALEMLNWVTTGFYASRRTMTILQPAIGSFYDGFQYSAKEVVSARDPWSGWIYYDGGLAVLQHFTSFAKMGWENGAEITSNGIWRGIPSASKSDLGQGNPPSGARNGNNSYTTMAAPDKSDFSTVAVNDSKYTKKYTVHLDKAMYDALGSDKTMELWETRAADSGEYDSNYMQPISEGTFTKVNDNDYAYTFTLKPWSVVTATSLDNASNNGGALTPKGTKGDVNYKGNKVPTSAEYTDVSDAADGAREVLDTDETGKTRNTTDNILYADNFDYKEEGNIKTWESGKVTDSSESFIDSRGGYKPAGTTSTDAQNGVTPRYTNDTNGAFESVATNDTAHGRVLRQQVGPGMAGGAWNGGDPITTIGDLRWANYKVSTDVLFEDGSGRYATLGARQQGGNNNGIGTSAAEIRVDTAGAWSFRRYGAEVASGTATNWQSGSNVWNNIAVQVAGNVYTAYINGVQVATYTDTDPEAAGRIQIGSSFNFTQFDNLKVETVDGYTPYYTDLIDGMHQTSWDDVTAKKLTYNDQWQHLNGKGMFEYQRTSSTSTGQGATVEYTFTGTGLDIAGNNSGTAKVNVYVDGNLIAQNARTYNNGNMRTNLQVRGLSYGEHTVKIETANGESLNVDYVGVIKTKTVTSDTKALADAVASYDDLVEAEWNAATWKVFKTNLDAAKEALDDAAAYGLDAEGAQALIDRLAAARKGLVDASISETVQNLGFTGVAAVKTDAVALPAKLAVKDGKETAVTWDDDAAAKLAAAADYSKVTLSGVTTDKQADGSKYRFTVEVEALPANVVYFIDSGTLNGADSPEYTAVKNLLGTDLLNDKVDQTSDGSTWGYDANAMKVKGNTDINDKQSTGIYSDDDDVTYYLPLKAGKYKLTAGFQEWWGMDNRESAQTVYAEDGKTVLATGDNVKLGKANPSLTGTVEFTLSADQTVRYVVSKVGNAQKPVISWLGVAAVADYGLAAAVVKDAELPAKVTVDGLSFDVKAWDESAKTAVANAADYSKVTVSGTKADGTKFSAVVEVIPSGVQYFIDSGTNGKDSPEYLAVKAAVQGLRNDKVDQTSDGSTWGYNADGQNTYGSGDINDKFSTGLWAGKGKSTIYYLPLPAGTYTVSAGFHEWWNQGRNMKVFVLDGEGKELSNGNADISGTMDFTSTSNAFTLKAPQTVTLKVDGVSADPVISWVAVAGTVDESYVDKTALNKAIADAKALDPAGYTADSWKGVADTLTEAETVAANDKATKAEVDAATAKLNDAIGKLVEVQFDDLGVIAAVSDKDLPTSVAGKTVAWSKASADAFKAAALYTTVEVKGTADNAPVKATVEVIPDGLQYFIDSGTSGVDSPEYTAVKTAVSGLLNDKVDQTSDGSTWGYDATAMKVKSDMDINDKQSTGIYSDDDDVTYYLPLKAGKYKLTAGFQEWWGQDNRESAQTVYAADGTTKLATGDNLKLGKANPNLTGTVEFTLDTDQTVRYVVSKVGDAQKPVISWLAVAKQADVAAKKFTVTFDANEGVFAGDAKTSVVEVESGKTVSAPADAPTRADHTFVNWTTDKEGKNVYTFADPVTKDLTLYAQWKANTVTPPATVDKSALQARVDEVNKWDPDAYTTTSWNRVQDKLTAADKVLKDDKASQDEVNKALDDLNKAVGELERVPSGGGTTVITKKQVSITGVTAADAWFDGKAHVGYTGTPSSDFKGTYEVTYKGSGSTVYGPSKDAPTAAGTYRVTISVPESDPTWYGSLALEFSIRSGSTVVGRFYAPGQDRHMWTASAAESGVLPGMGWNREGDAFTMDAHAGEPVFRLYDARGNQHLWTTSTTERDYLVSQGWNDEGIAFYENPTAKIDVYRLYNPWTGEHLWTTSILERDSLAALSNGAWTYEGVAFKALA